MVEDMVRQNPIRSDPFTSLILIIRNIFPTLACVLLFLVLIKSENTKYIFICNHIKTHLFIALVYFQYLLYVILFYFQLGSITCPGKKKKLCKFCLNMTRFLGTFGYRASIEGYKIESLHSETGPIPSFLRRRCRPEMAKERCRSS
jgi:hypothetical protein